MQYIHYKCVLPLFQTNHVFKKNVTQGCLPFDKDYLLVVK